MSMYSELPGKSKLFKGEGKGQDLHDGRNDWGTAKFAKGAKGFARPIV